MGNTGYVCLIANILVLERREGHGVFPSSLDLGVFDGEYRISTCALNPCISTNYFPLSFSHFPLPKQVKVKQISAVLLLIPPAGLPCILSHHGMID